MNFLKLFSGEEKKDLSQFSDLFKRGNIESVSMYFKKESHWVPGEEVNGRYKAGKFIEEWVWTGYIQYKSRDLEGTKNFKCKEHDDLIKEMKAFIDSIK
jgi:hypothetical protein